MESTYVDEPLEIFVKVGQIILALLVLGDELSLTLQEFLSLLLEGLALGSLVVDARHHEGVFVRFGMLRMLGKEFFNWNERELRVFVPVTGQ